MNHQKTNKSSRLSLVLDVVLKPMHSFTVLTPDFARDIHNAAISLFPTRGTSSYLSDLIWSSKLPRTREGKSRETERATPSLLS